MQIYPIHVATEGLLDGEIGIATRGWIIEAVPIPPVIVVPWIEPIYWIGEFDTTYTWIGEWDPDP